MSDENNWTQWVAAASAFGSAAAISVGGRNGAQNIFNQIRDPFISPVMTTQQNIAQKTIQNIVAKQGNYKTLSRLQQVFNIGSLKKVEQELMLNNQLIDPNLGHAMVREWEAAKEAVLPRGVQIGKIHASDPFEGVHNALIRNDSIYTQNVFRRFIANLKTLSIANGFDQNLKRVAKSVPSNLLVRPGVVPENLQGYIDELQSILGEELRVQRRGSLGEGELLFKLPGTKNTLFTLPEAFGPADMQPGLVRKGHGLHNVYAPGQFAFITETGELDKTMSFPEFKAQQITEAVRQAIQEGRPVTEAISALEERVGKFMDFMEPSLTANDFSLETIVKSQRLTVLDEKAQPISGVKAMEFMKRYGEKFTPTSATGRFQTLSSTELYGGFTEQIDFARKPWQWIKQYRPTPEAQKAIMESQYGTKMFDFLDSPMAIKQFGGPSGARLKTLYLSDSQIEKLRSFGVLIGDGELLVNKAFKAQSEVTRRRRITLKEITDELSSKLLYVHTQKGSPDIGDTLLGRTTTGELIAGAPNERIREVQPTLVKMSDGFVSGYNLVLEETVQMGEFEKKFGGLKGMARSMSFKDPKLSKAIKEITGMSSYEIREFGAIGRLSDISAKKDPALRAMQQFSAVVAEAATNPENAAAKKLIANPDAVMRRISHATNITKEIEQLAQDIGISKGTQAFDRIFGDDIVYGISRMHFGGPKKFTGAGRMGTVEPRILNLLYSSRGDFGTELGEEIMGRVIAGDPSRIAIHDQLRRTFASMAKEANVPKGVDIRSLDNANLKELRKTGGYIATGIEEMPSIYMPGYENIPKLAPYKTGDSITETAPIQKTFRNIEKTIRANLDGDISEKEAMLAFTKKGGFFSQLFQEFAPGGKGMGSIARGPVFGSRFLTAISGKSEFYEKIAKMGLEDSPVIGIPRSIGREMIEELGSYGVNSTPDTMEMLSRFESDKPIGGVIARHPFIGAYSMQPVQMIATDTSEPVVHIPEKGVTARVKGVGEEVRLTEGILQGMALDKDADIAMAMVVNKDMEKKIRTGLQTEGAALNSELRAYADHSIRMQLLKASKGAEDAALSRAEQIAAAGTKLGVVDEYVGRVSTQLSQARSAIVASDLDDASKLRSMGLLEWLEQQPISGKHLTASNVLNESFYKQMESIISGVAGNSKLLESTVRSMANNELADNLLGKGIEFEAPISFMGQEVQGVRGFELEKTTRQITEAVRNFQTETMGDVTRNQVEKFLQPGQMAQLSRNQIPAMLDATNVAKQAGQSSFAEMQKNVLNKMNRIASEVRGRVRPLAKPLMAGLAAAGATAFAFSGPPDTMESSPALVDRTGQMPPRQAVIGKANRDDVAIPEPSRQVMGEPTAPQMISNRSVVLDEAQANRSRDLRMRINAQNLIAMQRRELTSRLNSKFPGTVDINVRDSRRTLNQHTISDMLD